MLLMNLESLLYRHILRAVYFYAKHLCLFCIKQRQAVRVLINGKNRSKVLCCASINSNKCDHLARNNATT